MRLAHYFFQAERKLVVLSIIVSMVSGLLGAVLVGMIGQHLSMEKPPTFALIGLYSGLIIIVIGSNLVAKWLLFRLTAQYSYILHKDLVQQILDTPFNKLEYIGSPRLLSILAEDIKTISIALNQIPTFFVNIAVVSGCLLYLLWLSPLAFFVLSFVAVPVFFIFLQLHSKARHLLEHLFELRDTRFDHYEALTMGIKELLINVSRRTHFLRIHFDRNLTDIKNNFVAVRMAQEMANSWSQSAYFFLILVLFLLIMFNAVDASIIGSYALVTLYMRNSINQLLNVIPQWTQANMALQKIEELDLAPTQAQFGKHSKYQAVAQDLTLKFTDIRYDNIDESSQVSFSLGPMDLQFDSGEIVFITGSNGSGKTTLLKILTSLYIPENGSISLNDIKLDAQNINWYRQHFSIIFTDYFLFKDIVHGNVDNEQERLAEYIETLELGNKVTIEDGSISTLRLSHGQCKRLALLHAYIDDKPIYVFDEWAENQDPVFRETFYRQLLPELKARGKLVIAVSHDDRYFDTADRVIHLDKGKLVSSSA